MHVRWRFMRIHVSNQSFLRKYIQCHVRNKGTYWKEALIGIRVLINKMILKGECLLIQEGAYWKEGTKSNHCSGIDLNSYTNDNILWPNKQTNKQITWSKWQTALYRAVDLKQDIKNSKLSVKVTGFLHISPTLSAPW